MIELKAKAEGTGVSCTVTGEGKGRDLLEESYAGIQGIIANLKKADEALWIVLISLLVDETDWLCADEEETPKTKLMN